MRMMSFGLTAPQMRARTKSVTRRMGWRFAKSHERVQAVVHSMGLKKGQHVERICVIEFVIIERERLQRLIDEPAYGRRECVREGFPHWTPEQFVAFFCASHKGCRPGTEVTRLEFKFVEVRR